MLCVTVVAIKKVNGCRVFIPVSKGTKIIFKNQAKNTRFMVVWHFFIEIQCICITYLLPGSTDVTVLVIM